MLYRLAAALLLLLLATPVLAQAFKTGTDWAQTGAEAERQTLPVVILITDDNCGYCERMRREFLLTAATATLLKEGAITREFQRSSGGKVTDFDGERIRTRIFLSRYGIFATPTLLILDPSGEPLTPALVGYNDAETYAQMVSQRLDEAKSMLASHERMAHTALANTDR